MSCIAHTEIIQGHLTPNSFDQKLIWKNYFGDIFFKGFFPED